VRQCTFKVIISESQVISSSGKVIVSESQVISSSGKVIVSESQVILSSSKVIVSESQVGMRNSDNKSAIFDNDSRKLKLHLITIACYQFVRMMTIQLYIGCINRNELMIWEKVSLKVKKY
jgi:hypothetical protein